MEFTKEKANQFLKENVEHIDYTFRSNFHMEPTIGWMNDPNGLIYFNGEFHLFYQANPFATTNFNLAWGHFISKNLIEYYETDFALYPEPTKKETGCFSGSGFVYNNELALVYTRHYENDGKTYENQYIASSKDTINFTKFNAPNIDISELPKDIDQSNFRDPQIIKRGDIFYMFVGSATIDRKGVLLIFKGNDPKNMHFDFMIGPYPEFYLMVECPSYVNIGGKDIILYSTYGVEKRINSHLINNVSFYIMGQLDFEHKVFKKEKVGLLDSGDAYYAPKIIENFNEPISIGWMENWCKKYKTHELNHHWCGSFAFPRLLSVKNNTLYQTYYPIINKYLLDAQSVKDNESISKTGLLSLNMENDSSITFSGLDGSFSLYLKDGHICLDTLHSNNLHEMIIESLNMYSHAKVIHLLSWMEQNNISNLQTDIIQKLS